MFVNPFRKKQPIQEGQYQREPYLPPDLEGFKRSVIREPEPHILEMPEHERKFHAFAREIGSPQDVGLAFEEGVKEKPAGFSQKPADNSDRLDMVLQKLETIDLRLKVIEQKIERRPI